MDPMVTATYFPFSHVSPSLLEVLPCLFDRLILFQPAGSPSRQSLRTSGPMPPNTGTTDHGWPSFLGIRTFRADAIDERQLHTALRNWKTWGIQYQKDLNYMKHMRESLAPNSPVIPALVSEIKGMGPTRNAETDALFACHLFLLLAQDFDGQSLELKAQLASVAKQRESLLSSIRTGLPEDEPQTVSADPFSDRSEDLGALMTENRMNAWTRLFRKEADQGYIFVTDSPAVYRYVLDGAEDNVDMGRLRLPGPESKTEQDAVREAFRQALAPLLNTPWNRGALQETAEAAGAMWTSIGSVHDEDAPPSHDSLPSRWALVPKLGDGFIFRTNQGRSSDNRTECFPSTALIGLIE